MAGDLGLGSCGGVGGGCGEAGGLIIGGDCVSLGVSPDDGVVTLGMT